MSALPTASAIPPLARSKPPASRRKKRTVLTATHRSRSHRGLGASPKGRGILGTDFASVYHTYRRRVYSQCFSMLRNHDDAEDAAQEVFFQLFRKAHTFRGESSFSTWLYRLTTNCVLMEIRKIRNRCLHIVPQASLGTDSRSPVMDTPLDAFQGPSAPIFDQLCLGAAMSQLPTGYQEIFNLHDVEGYTHQEVSALLGVQIGTSKSQLHKARLRMRLLLQTGRGGPQNHPLKLEDYPMVKRGQTKLTRP